MRSYYGLLCGIPAGGNSPAAPVSESGWSGPAIGSVGDAFDNALAETTIGLCKTEAIRDNSPFRRGPLTRIAGVETLTADWVHWYNTSRLMHRLPAHRRSNTTPTTMHTAPNDQPVPDNPVGTKPGMLHNASEACTCRSGPTSRNRAPSPVQWWSGIDRGGRRVP